MSFAFWIPKSIHTQYVILIAFPLQQRFNERASLLCYKYMYCLYFKGLSYQNKLPYEGQSWKKRKKNLIYHYSVFDCKKAHFRI